ncbi:MAG: HAD-IC family P-type ATPase, partial [Chloroflexota bacterium]|nr:HAD-IC family P-type ATPase [Chloroflexota bacterium]
MWQTAFAPVNVVLFGVSALLVVLGLPLDAGVTTIPVLLNVLVSAGLEVSAKWRLDRLRILSTPKVTVIRDGHERSIDLRELVRGDVVVVQRGDQVVLDGEIVEGELEVDESLLTGESEAVIRRRGDQLLSGSACVSGRATMQVIHVGLDSYASQLTAQAQSLREERTPLQRDVDRSIVITAVVVMLVSVVAAIAYADAPTTRTEVVQAAAVLVALVPQGLAIMITVTYAAGALRISRAGALVQRINAVESMSRVDTLILDKTGTITSPRFELREFLPLEVDEPTARRLLQAVAPAMGKGDRIGAAIARSSLVPESSAPAPADVIPFSSARCHRA